MKVSPEAWTWFWSLSINEQNQLIEKHFPEWDKTWSKTPIIMNRSNIQTMYEKEHT